jgi:hypothetical protein
VVIDGIRYAPVSEAHIDAAAIEDAVVGQWGGDNWRASFPDAPGYLRIIISDDERGGETVTDFIARLVNAVEGNRRGHG